MLFIWYLRQLLARFSYICKNIYELKRTVDIYKKHLAVVSELEMFYKDPTIEHLSQHTQDLLEQLKTYEEFYDLLSKEDINNIPIEIEEIEEDESRQRQEQDSETKEEKAAI
jgi:ASC-1-like (ASCH) protein